MRVLFYIAVFSGLIAFNSIATAQVDHLDDADIRCFSNESCSRLVGKRVWVTINTSEICDRIFTPRSCQKVQPGYSFVIRRTLPGSDGSEWLAFEAKPGVVSYYSLSNAHLLTFRDPKAAAITRQKRKQQDAIRSANQDKADAEALAAIPRTELEKACIVAAAERLPAIPGIQILQSKTGPIPANLDNKDPKLFMTLVHIDTKAAGQDVTFHFLCSRGARTPVFIQRLAQ